MARPLGGRLAQRSPGCSPRQWGLLGPAPLFLGAGGAGGKGALSGKDPGSAPCEHLGAWLQTVSDSVHSFLSLAWAPPQEVWPAARRAGPSLRRPDSSFTAELPSTGLLRSSKRDTGDICLKDPFHLSRFTRKRPSHCASDPQTTNRGLYSLSVLGLPKLECV